MKERLDVLLVKKGLAESREKAKAIITEHKCDDGGNNKHRTDDGAKEELVACSRCLLGACRD